MEIRDLRYFLTLAETLHFGRAAEREYIAQSAFSQHIAKLEGEMGVTLFARRSSRVRLTDAGEAFLPRAQKLLRQLQDAQDEARAIAGGAAGVLRVGLFVGAGGELTPLMLSTYRDTFPDVRLDFREVTMTTQVDAVTSGDVDVAILYLPICDARLEQSVLFAEPRFAALARRHELADASSVTVAALADEPFAIARSPAPSAWSSFWRCDDERGEPGRTGASVATVQECLAAISLFGAVDTVPASGARCLFHPDVRFVLMDDGAYASVAVVRRVDDDRALVNGFLDVASRVAEEHRAIVPLAVAPADAPAGTPMP